MVGTMTIKQLIKELQKLEKKVPRGTPVVIEHKNFGKLDYTHDNFSELQVETITWAKEDCVELADGSERYKIVVTIKG